MWLGGDRPRVVTSDPREALASRLRVAAAALLAVSVLRVDTNQGILGSLAASLVLVLGDQSFLAAVQRVISSGRCV